MTKCICDRCGHEIVPNVDARYTPATSADGTSGRHWACHTPVDVALNELRAAMTDVEKLFAQSDARRQFGSRFYRK